MAQKQSYTDYLGKYRKKNGEKLVESTKERYNDFISRFRNELEDTRNIFDFMNRKIRQQNNIILYSAFRTYLLYLGYSRKEIRDNLETPQMSATAFSSKRFLQSKVLSRKEIQILYSEQKDLMIKLMINILYDTACRRDELLKIRYKDIEILNEPDENIYAKVLLHGKGQKTREVYLGKRAVELLEKYKSPEALPDDYLIRFIKHDGELYVKQDDELRRRIMKACKTSLDRHVHPHMFRHTRLTHFADAGLDVQGICAYAGHEDIKTTQKYIEISSFMGKRMFKSYSEDII